MRDNSKKHLMSITERITVDVETGCWNWTGRIAKDGYGKWERQGHTVMPHRVVYEIVCGPIPFGLQLDHLCRNRACVNPAHLEPVTARENILRGHAPSIILHKLNRCKRGHEFTPENTQWSKGRNNRDCRACRTCQREWHRTNKLAKRGAA